uniref:Proline rich 29 n=1 Tax=Canis lupus familiaris TaxID=9615 RepID=A0A8C0T140_CANLF
MASDPGGCWGQPPPQGAAGTENRAPAPTPQCHRHCGCG